MFRPRRIYSVEYMILHYRRKAPTFVQNRRFTEEDSEEAKARLVQQSELRFESKTFTMGHLNESTNQVVKITLKVVQISKNVERGKYPNMKLNHFEEIEQLDVEMAGASGCKVRWLVGKADGAPNFSLRQFEVAAGGFTPRHSHPYEHEVFVLEGRGTVSEGDREHEIKPGVVLYVAPDEVHQFKNSGDSPLKFLCLIPNSALDMPVTQAPECGRD